MSKYKVKCEICGESFSVIHLAHLKSHDITLDEYKKKFPNAEYYSEEYSKNMRRNKTKNKEWLNPDEYVKKIEDLYWKEGKTQKEIADIFEVNQATISYFMKRNKINKGIKIERGNRISNTLHQQSKSTEHKRNLSISRKEYYVRNPEEKKRMKMQRLNQEFPKKDTKIEIKTFEWLEKNGIEFKKHKKVDDICKSDAFVEPNIYIFCDGNYWHGNPNVYETFDNIQTRNIEHDKIVNEKLKETTYVIVRIWETEIKKGDFSKLKSALDLE
jgi:G:T-mismatch repair DNA endonuclease (very short patch repair protein)